MRSRFIVLLTICALFAIQANAQSQPKVLAEMFSNTNCGNCNTPDEAFQSFMDANPSYGIVRINYHNKITNALDTFYLASLASARERSDVFYNLSANPVGIINGQPSGGSSDVWSALCKTKGLTSTPITVTASKSGDGMIHIHVVNTNHPTVPVRAYLALTESNYMLDNPLAYGNPKSGHWDDILRQILPTPSGTDAFSATGNDTWDFTFDPSQEDDIGDFWNPDNMKAIVWLQDDQGSVKKVEALGVTSLKNLSGVSATNPPSSFLRIEGNPVIANTRFSVSLESSAHVRLLLSDLLGREISVVADARMPAGLTTIQLNGNSLPAGCYVARLVVDDAEVDHAKLIVP